jgi:serine/threonine protein kinase
MKTSSDIFIKDEGDRDSGIIDVMRKLLILDPNKRVTASDALLHPFFQ